MLLYIYELTSLLSSWKMTVDIKQYNIQTDNPRDAGVERLHIYLMKNMFFSKIYDCTNPCTYNKTNA